MVESLNAFTQEPSRSDQKRWIGQVAIAVILGEAIWAFIVSLANGLVLPAIGKLVGGGAQSPLSASTPIFNVFALVGSFVQLCLAGVAGVILYSWANRVPAIKSIPATQMPVLPLPAAAASDANASVALTTNVPVQPGPSVKMQPRPQSVTSRDRTKPTETKPPKVIRYNIVGDPVQDD